MERKEREHIRQEWVEKQEKIKSKHCYIVMSPRYHENCLTWQKIMILKFLSFVTLGRVVRSWVKITQGYCKILNSDIRV